MISLRASSLGGFNTCPYKWKYDKFNINQRMAYFGDIIHYAGRSDKESSKKLLEYYNKEINPDLQLKIVGVKLIVKLTEYMSNLSNEYDLYYEVPFRELTDTYVLQGTADVVAIHKKTGELLVVDYKTSASQSWYEGEDIWNENLQTQVYPYFAMKVFNKGKAKFRFVVLQKNTSATVKEYEREFTLKDVDKNIHQVIDDIVNAEVLEDYPAKECRYCNFCKLKAECPLYKLKEQEDEMLF